MAGTRLKDVAERAGVSIKTVSNVVRGNVRVAEPTRRRVLDAIDELDYRPNASARHLRTGRSGVIALAVPELVAPYFAELATAVIEAAREHDVSVLIEDTGGDPAAELRVACGLSDPLIDGVLLSPIRLDQATLARRERRVPLVLLGERDFEVPADHVLIDNVLAAEEATAHLLASGRRRVAAIGFQSDPLFTTSHQRARGYLRALETAGLPHAPELTPLVPAFTRTHGMQAMRDLLALPEPPDAVFCFSDLLASGAVRAVYDAGRAVPGDVAVIGFDDIEDTRFAVPSLSTIAPDKRQLAKLAVDSLLTRIAGDPEAPHTTLYAPYRLVARESTAPDAGERTRAT